MSDRPGGILAYGYDLGGRDDWKFPANSKNLLWWNSSSKSFETNLLDRLNIVIQANKLKPLDVQVVIYGSWSYPRYILASSVHTADDWGTARVIEISLDHSAAQRLGDACEILGIEPQQSEPKWILASFYG